MASPPPPAQRLCATFEILEHIFLYLPIEIVYSIQTVCHRWKSLIANSPRLQRHIFQIPSGNGPFRLVSINRGPISYEFLNPPVRVPRSLSHIRSICVPNPQISQILGGRGVRNRKLSDAISRTSLRTSHHPAPAPLESIRLLHRCPFPRNLNSDWFAQQDRSWRSMFLSQPPVTAVELRISYDARSGWEGGSVHTIYNKNGVTVGQLVGALRGREKSFPESPCMLDLYVPVDEERVRRSV